MQFADSVDRLGTGEVAAEFGLHADHRRQCLHGQRDMFQRLGWHSTALSQNLRDRFLRLAQTIDADTMGTFGKHTDVGGKVRQNRLNIDHDLLALLKHPEFGRSLIHFHFHIGTVFPIHIGVTD